MVGTPDSWCMGLSVLELSHVWLFKKEPGDAERCPTVFHISLIQHDGAVIREDKLTHHRRRIISKDLKPEEINQVTGLKVSNQFLEEHGIDIIQTNCWSLAILVGLHLAAGCQLEDVTMDLCRVDICDRSGLGPASPNGFEGRPQHDFVFLHLEVPVDEMESKYFLDVETCKESSKLLKVNLLHLWLVSIVW